MPETVSIVPNYIAGEWVERVGAVAFVGLGVLLLRMIMKAGP